VEDLWGDGEGLTLADGGYIADERVAVNNIVIPGFAADKDMDEW
jgi:hypothetical protein